MNRTSLPVYSLKESATSSATSANDAAANISGVWTSLSSVCKHDTLPKVATMMATHTAALFAEPKRIRQNLLQSGTRRMFLFSPTSSPLIAKERAA